MVDLVPGDASRAEFYFQVNILQNSQNELDFRGPFVHGKKGDRFLYLSWRELRRKRKFTMFRRAKLHLKMINPEELARAFSSVTPKIVEGLIDLTDNKGGPVCGSILKEKIVWRLVSPSIEC